MVESNYCNASHHLQARLSNLLLANYDVEVVTARTLSGLSSLYSLSLSRNKLSWLPPGWLQDCPRLARLDLSNNLISALPSQTFSGSLELTSLDLSNNRLTSLAGVAGLPHLQSLLVSHNNLQAVSLCQLAPSSRLTTLELSHTNLTSLSTECGEEAVILPLLSSLDISGNWLGLASLDLTSSLPALLNISLAQHNLTVLGPAETAGLPPSLASLHLSHSELSQVLPGALARLTRLQRLELTDNPGLSWLPPGLLPSSQRPLAVNLSSNGLTWLPPSCLPSSRLSLLDLSNNPLHCDCELSWLTEVSSLVGGQCASPPDLANVNINQIKNNKMSCSILRPAQISVLSLSLILVSLLLGCVSFGCFTCRRKPRGLAIADMRSLEVSKQWQTLSNDYSHHQQSVSPGEAASRWTFVQPPCDCHPGTAGGGGGVFTIRSQQPTRSLSSDSILGPAGSHLRSQRLPFCPLYLG